MENKMKDEGRGNEADLFSALRMVLMENKKQGSGADLFGALQVALMGNGNAGFIAGGLGGKVL